MTIQAIIFLYHFKKIQAEENGTVWIDMDNRKMYTVIESKESISKSRDLSHIWASIPSMLQYLKDSGFLNKHGREYYSLTYAGYHYYQTITSSFFRFLLNSVVVPIFVSIITTIALFAFERWLH